ncbi:MAG: hypothetical protein J7J46_07620 [Candidatus Desulfofervidus sp.]|nr:hypothetical protein [Candidatus Desulfofervidus sp.]
MDKTKKRFLVFGLCPGIWFLLAIFPYFGWFGKVSFVSFCLSGIYIAIFGNKPYLWLGFWGGLLDVYKGNTLGPYFTGFLCMGWLMSKTRHKFIPNFPNQIILSFLAILFLHGWGYGWEVIFDLNKNVYKIKEVLTFALIGACLTPFIFKFYNVLAQDVH